MYCYNVHATRAFRLDSLIMCVKKKRSFIKKNKKKRLCCAVRFVCRRPSDRINTQRNWIQGINYQLKGAESKMHGKCARLISNKLLREGRKEHLLKIA